MVRTVILFAKSGNCRLVFLKLHQNYLESLYKEQTAGTYPWISDSVGMSGF